MLGRDRIVAGQTELAQVGDLAGPHRRFSEGVEGGGRNVPALSECRDLLHSRLQNLGSGLRGRKLVVGRVTARGDPTVGVDSNRLHHERRGTTHGSSVEGKRLIQTLLFHDFLLVTLVVYVKTRGNAETINRSLHHFRWARSRCGT